MSGFISYLRVSTDKQGMSGLGIEAQRAAIAAHLASTGGTQVAEYVEVESGKADDRVRLAEALAHCRKAKSSLLIAKLDRLSRKVRLIAELMESQVPFVACDMPNARPFELHIRAAIAEEEVRMISERTKAALKAAKARGVKLGGCRATLLERADEHARQLYPLIAEHRSKGLSLRQIAAILTQQGVKTARNGIWTATTVKNILDRR